MGLQNGEMFEIDVGLLLFISDIIFIIIIIYLIPATAVGGCDNIIFLRTNTKKGKGSLVSFFFFIFFLLNKLIRVRVTEWCHVSVIQKVIIQVNVCGVDVIQLEVVQVHFQLIQSLHKDTKNHLFSLELFGNLFIFHPIYPVFQMYC